MDANVLPHLEDSDDECCNVRKKMKLENNKNCYLDDDLNLMPVLADEFTNNPTMIPVYIADITDKRETSKLLKNLQTVFPLSGLQHLKRVRLNEGSLQVIVCTLQDVKGQTSEVPKKLSTKSLFDENIKGLSETVVLHHVNSSLALTRNQYNYGSKFWPQHFHEDKYITKLMNGTLFSREETLIHCKFMSKAIELAYLANSKNELPIGAVIVDSQIGKIIALGYDRRKRHPLQHSVMIAIDQVARRQGGGVWNLCDPKLDVDNNDSDVTLDPKNSPYLCTNYDLYVTREPCTMCSMALVHSRIKRVFYSVGQKRGALGTISKIHVLPELNHHFEVFSGLLHNHLTESLLQQTKD